MLSEKINTAKSLSFRSRCQRPEGAMGNGKSCTADLKPKINNLKALQKTVVNQGSGIAGYNKEFGGIHLGTIAVAR